LMESEDHEVLAAFEVNQCQSKQRSVLQIERTLDCYAMIS
jgi:hypothetical protein